MTSYLPPRIPKSMYDIEDEVAYLDREIRDLENHIERLKDQLEVEKTSLALTLRCRNTLRYQLKEFPQ